MGNQQWISVHALWLGELLALFVKFRYNQPQ